MLHRSTLRSGLIALTLTGLLAACGSSATPTATATLAGGPTSTPTSTETSPGSSAGAIPSFDLNSLSAAIPGLDSYRTSLSTNGVVKWQTVVVEQPTLSKATTTFADDGVTVDSRFVVIGDQIWTATGPDGKFTLLPAAVGNAALLAFDPSTLLSAYATMDWTGLATTANEGVETKNGVQATHLKVDATTYGLLATAWPAGASIDVWIASSGYIVAWEMTGFASGQDVAIEVSNVNDPANVVTAPTT